jgi:hypothetical protein
VRGSVRDQEGKPLPFAWVTAGDSAQTACSSSVSGEFTLYDLSESARTLFVTAPGYWGQAATLTGGERLDVTLTRRPDMQRVSWGSGAVMLPAETLASVSADQITLTRGWVWGSGITGLTINTPEVAIALRNSATFAMERLPDETAWLYLTDGEALVTATDGGQAITVQAGEMLAFGEGVAALSPVPLDVAVVRALHADQASPTAFEGEPDLIARLRDELARLGINAAQALTFATYSAVLLAVVGAPLLALRRWLRARRSGESDIR